MKEILSFLEELSANNNREWFEANRERYRGVQAQMNTLTEELIERLSHMDPTLTGLAVKDCTYRIYRDTRFSNDKTPYKSHIGTYICRGGKKSGFAGYYLHLEPTTAGGAGSGLLLGKSMLCAGSYGAENYVLQSIREEINDHSDLFAKNLAAAKGFSMDGNQSLVRVPRGFDPEHPMAKYLKLKDFSLYRPLTPAQIAKKDFVDEVVRLFSTCKPIVDQINRATEYAFEMKNETPVVKK